MEKKREVKKRSVTRIHFVVTGIVALIVAGSAHSPRQHR